MRMSTQAAPPHGARQPVRGTGDAEHNEISQTATATAILFPGQGSQTSEMRELVARERPDLLQAVVDEVGEDPFPRADDGTHFAQPAIFCASLAGWASIGSPAAELMAGHSLGELGALVAAGALDERDALALVTLRGKLMYEAGLEAGDGSMVAVIGAGAADHAQEIADASSLTVANDNSPMQIVLSGAKASIPAGIDVAKALGLRAMELDVTGAFHSSMMAAAVPEFERALADVAFREPVTTTVISAVTAQPFADPRRELADALTQPVRWREVLLAMHERGARRFVDVGPGRVLTGLAKRTLKGVELVNA
jgi:[acyl-carrier-protein] S-malonyltransferase